MKNKGFTLIELLVVIALIGVLAGVILVVIDPLEQFARGRDAARKSTLRQIVGAEQAYFVGHNAQYPNLFAPGQSSSGADAGTWINNLVSAGELKQVPSIIAYADDTKKCVTRNQVNLCIDGDLTQSPTSVVIYTRLESKSEGSKCTSGNAYFFWGSDLNKAGIKCAASDGALWTGRATDDLQ